MRWTALAIAAVLLVCGCDDQPYQPQHKSQDDVRDANGGPNAASPTNDEPDGAPALGLEVDAGRIRLTAPSSWQRRQPRSQFTLAEFALPKAEGDEQDGRLTVSMAGGSVAQNLQRWRGQFAGQQKADAVKQLDIAGLNVSVVDLSGTFNDQAGPFAPAVERQGYRMLGAIVPVDDQLHFIKAYGPAKTMAQHEEAFDAFLKTLQRR